MQLVWFKRDLRLHDHAALHGAIRQGPVLGLYVFEPGWIQAPTTDPSHVEFVWESVQELAAEFRARGGSFWIVQGEMPQVLDRIFEHVRFEGLWSHQETTDLWGYRRDRKVKRWCGQRRIPWTEPPHNGVVRGPDARKAWARTWEARAARPIKAAPDSLVTGRGLAEPPPLPEPTREDLGVAPSNKPERVLGGERRAHQVLDTFLHARGAHYRTDLSSPVTSWEGCSRLGPYITYGNLSIRQVWQASRTRLTEVTRMRKHGDSDPLQRSWIRSLESFESRLRWHCHFIQKLESEPSLEVKNAHRAYDGIRTEDPDDWTDAERANFEAWRHGQTGFPMVDAVMRALHAGGWINFRMRAMLASFACHHLWLHWRPAAVALAPHFLDYEPGIHYSQFQMHAGTFGMNTTRIYSPAKQAKDQDPDGVFIRRYVPELQAVPTEYIAEPHRMPTDLQARLGVRIGKDYPKPVVDPARSYAQAKGRLESIKRSQGARRETQRVFERHGSRRRRWR